MQAKCKSETKHRILLDAKLERQTQGIFDVVEIHTRMINFRDAVDLKIKSDTIRKLYFSRYFRGLRHRYQEEVKRVRKSRVLFSWVLSLLEMITSRIDIFVSNIP